MKCPKCRHYLEDDAASHECGWIQGEEDEPKRNSSRCAWTKDGKTCRSLGAISPSTLGGGPWYCSKHWGELKGYNERPTRKEKPKEATPAPAAPDEETEAAFAAYLADSAIPESDSPPE